MESHSIASPEKETTAQRRRATFFATAYHKVSARNQVAMPRHMLKVLSESSEGQLLLVWWNGEGYLRLYTQQQMDEMIERIQHRENLTLEERAALTRSLSNNAVPIDPDSQGRFVLPSHWVEMLNLREEIAFCGTFNRIEIWPAEARRDADRKEREQLAAMASKVTDILDL